MPNGCSQLRAAACWQGRRESQFKEEWSFAGCQNRPYRCSDQDSALFALLVARFSSIRHLLLATRLSRNHFVSLRAHILARSRDRCSASIIRTGFRLESFNLRETQQFPKRLPKQAKNKVIAKHIFSARNCGQNIATAPPAPWSQCILTKFRSFRLLTTVNRFIASTLSVSLVAFKVLLRFASFSPRGLYSVEFLHCKAAVAKIHRRSRPE